MYLNEIRKYWNLRAEGYMLTVQGELKGSRREYFESLLMQAAPEGEELKCLDIGCGPGFFTVLLAKHGHKVTAMDYSEEMLMQARKNVADHHQQVETIQGDAQALPFEDESFDYIVSRNLVWNLEEPEKAYREWMRVLKKGGHLFVADGNHYLHYYNEAYATPVSVDETAHSCHGVDPAPIDNIARDLPLSKEVRPDWDMNVLADIGLVNVHCISHEREYLDKETNNSILLPYNFELWGEKR